MKAKQDHKQHDKQVYVSKSAIHGRGIFAAKTFRSEDLIGVFEGRPTRRDGRHVLWLSDTEALRVENDLRFINHSAAPNAEARGTELVALRPIKPGNEITIHYGDDWDEEQPTTHL